MRFLKLTKPNLVLYLIGLVTLVSFWYWYMYMTSTSAIVKVIEVKEEEITVENMAGETTVVRIPRGIHTLIEENEYYFVIYESRRLEAPKLKRIEPAEY